MTIKNTKLWNHSMANFFVNNGFVMWRHNTSFFRHRLATSAHSCIGVKIRYQQLVSSSSYSCKETYWYVCCVAEFATEFFTSSRSRHNFHYVAFLKWMQALKCELWRTPNNSNYSIISHLNFYKWMDGYMPRHGDGWRREPRKPASSAGYFS